MSVLLVDGDNLLTIGFYGLKNHYYKGKHIGAIYHFINTLRRAFEIYQLDKIVVFWDGENSSQERKKIYFQYKENRRSNRLTEEGKNSYNYQRTRIKRYLEELYVRQGEFANCESDDCIAYYTHNSPNEKKIVYSSDRDLAQLVNKDVSLYNPSHGKLYEPNSNIEYDKETILIENENFYNWKRHHNFYFGINMSNNQAFIKNYESIKYLNKAYIYLFISVYCSILLPSHVLPRPFHNNYYLIVI